MADLPSVPGAAPSVPHEPLLVDAPAACIILGGISDRTLWSMTKAGEVPHVRVRRRVMYSPEALRQWVAARTQGGAR